MKIRTKVLIAPSLVLLLMLAMSAFGWYALRLLSLSLHEIVEVRSAAVIGASKYLDGIDRVHIQAYRYFSWLGNADEKVLAGVEAELQTLMAAGISEIEAVAHDGRLSLGSRQNAGRLQEANFGYLKSIKAALDMAAVDAATGKQMMQASDDMFRKLRTDIAAWSAAELQGSRTAYVAAIENESQALRNGAGLLFAAIVTGIGISVWLSSIITRPLLLATSVAQELARGRIIDVPSTAGTTRRRSCCRLLRKPPAI